jgi:2-methylcitrate dehydratase
MIEHVVRVHPSSERLPRERQLAFAMAEFAAASPSPDPEAAAMVACRLVDNAAVALAAINRAPVAAARAQALAHPRSGGATLFGIDPARAVHAQWAAWANAVAVRELDFHDTFLAREFGHPGDCISPLVAVAQQCGCDGNDLTRGILVAYEVHVALMKSISLHLHKKDHLAHLAPGTAAGIGAMLHLSPAVIFQAVNQAVHLSFSTRQSRKGEISSWKAYVPGFSGKLAVEAVDRAMRCEAAPSPIYEGEDSVIAWMLDGPDAEYRVSLPAPGEAPRAILETYTKAHSAEYQSQALIDLAFEIRKDLDLSAVKEIVVHTSHHTHAVIGTGANDPQKMDPGASRETLDHSIMYILAVALEDGEWHHDASYGDERAHRASTVSLWHRIRTQEDPQWNARYLEPDPARRAFGGRLEVVMKDGSIFNAEKAVADAHPNGLSPWGWDDYVGKLDRLTSATIDPVERQRFVDLAARPQELTVAEVRGLNPALRSGQVMPEEATGEGIFDHAGG